MQQTVPEFEDLLKALSEHGVRYVIVGGFAMVLQGAVNVTFDFDFAIALDEANIQATVEALRPFRPFPPQYGSNETFVWDERSFKLAMIELATDAGHVDILSVLPGIDSFDGLLARSETRLVGGVEVRVASLADLIAMKEAAGREKDRDHIRQLKALRELRKEI